ncbi:hypothetical protein [Desulfospira joergensenii]|nr:hypothetical protein [Desulfospira joergensenii]
MQFQYLFSTGEKNLLRNRERSLPEGAPGDDCESMGDYRAMKEKKE